MELNSISKRNIDRFDNVQVIPKAVSDKKGRKKLLLSDILPAWHTLERDVHVPFSDRPIVDGDRYSYVEVDTIDNIIFDLQIDHIDFMKMDIIGAELRALKGAVETLQKTKHVFVAPQKNASKVREFLEKNDFITKVEVYSPEIPYILVYGTKVDLNNSRAD